MSDVVNERIQKFVLWTKENLKILLKQPADIVANRIGDAILAVDDRLGVEVANQADRGVREVIFTAFSNPELFPVVH